MYKILLQMYQQPLTEKATKNWNTGTY